MKDLDYLWAKKMTDKLDRPRWLPLRQHLLDTRFIAKQLYQHFLSDGQREIIRNSIDPHDEKAVERVVQLTATFHDIGKATPAFQEKQNQQSDNPLDRTIDQRLIAQKYLDSGHPLLNTSSSPHALAGETILYHTGIDNDVGALVGNHHGKGIDHIKDIRRQAMKYPNNYYLKKNPKDPIHQHWDQAQKELTQWCLMVNGYHDTKDVPKIKSIAAQVILEGLLVTADWIASNQHYFPLFNLSQDRSRNLPQRLQSGWERWHDDNEWHPTIHKDADRFYQKRFGFSPHPLQRRLFNRIKKTKHPGITIIESGMGSGKTEAALATAEQVARKDGNKGIFFCLPTQGSTNAMFNRVKAWLDSIAQDNKQNQNIRLAHGKAAMNPDFNSLPNASDIGRDEEQATVTVNHWFKGKMIPLNDFVVGTIDQLLLMSLKQRHLALRHLGLSQKVVIADEIHSYDAFMNQYLYRSLEWLGKYHVPVIMLSATLPASKREEMIQTYLDAKDDDGNLKKLDLPIPKDTYPLVTYSDNGAPDKIDNFTLPPSHSVQIIRFNGNLSKKLQGLLVHGGVIGIIVNTVKHSQELAHELINDESNGIKANEVELLHASFINRAREDKENELLKGIGKESQNRPYRKIIIGTQVLEQSLDIDFDALFSTICPSDLLTQRLGRMHRHKANDVKRPKEMKEPRLYVMGTNDKFQFDGGTSAIYGDYLLMRTQYYLPDSFEFPRSIAPFVQNVYDNEQLHVTKDKDIDMKLSNPKIIKHYHDAREKQNGKLIKKEKGADQFRLADYDNLHDNLIGWLKNDIKDDEQGLAQVRDGANSIEVIVVKAVGDNGYTFIDKKEDISDCIDERGIDYRLAKDTLRLPNQIVGDKYQEVIQELRDRAHPRLDGWEDHPFLRGQLALILDDNLQCQLNGFRLKYNFKYGLEYVKEGG